MIQENKNYLINGWAVYVLVDVLKYVKRQTELNRKKYSKEDFVEVIDSYHYIIKYLLTLKKNKENNNIYIKEDDYTSLEKLLKSMKITFSKDKNNDKRKRK